MLVVLTTAEFFYRATYEHEISEANNDIQELYQTVAATASIAAFLEDEVPEDVSHQRLQILQKKLDESQRKFNMSFIGQKLSVLFEKKGKKINQYVGRSQYLQPVHVNSDKSLIGKILDIKINKVESYSLHGET